MKQTSRRAHPVDAHVGRRLRERRTELGLSQTQLGERLGLTFQQVQKYEKGANRIGASRLLDMSIVLGVGVQSFYEGLPLPCEVPGQTRQLAIETAIEALVATADGIELNRSFVRLAEPQRRAVVDLVRSLALDRIA